MESVPLILALLLLLLPVAACRFPTAQCSIRETSPILPWYYAPADILIGGILSHPWIVYDMINFTLPPIQDLDVLPMYGSSLSCLALPCLALPCLPFYSVG